MDLIDHPTAVKEKLLTATQEYFQVYDIFYNMLRGAKMPITSWLPLIHTGKYYIVSCDFSCMISPQMFEEFIMPILVEECRFLERSIYHLDGPGALKHLDMILSIPELDAAQWVPGAGNEGYARWVEVYQRSSGLAKDAGTSMSRAAPALRPCVRKVSVPPIRHHGSPDPRDGAES